MTYTKFHEELPEGWWSPLKRERDHLRELPLTSSTVAVKLGRHGVIVLTCTSLINPVYFSTEMHVLAGQKKKISLLEYKLLWQRYIYIYIYVYIYQGWPSRRATGAALYEANYASAMSLFIKANVR